MNHFAAGRLRSGLLIWAMALTAALPSHLAVPAPADAASSALSPAAGTADEGIGPGAPGLGDPYYPLDGNGGYDVEHYLLELSYDPPTGLLAGSATIRARTTGNLSAFNLDLDGLTVRAVRVNGREAAFSRSGAELTVTPKKAIRDGREFEAVIDYDGVPKLLVDQFGPSGFFRTDDGSLVIGQPHVAATWFPSNDHPLDKASFTFKITVPDGLEVVANGVLRDKESEDGKATWTWQASEPMATYLATASVGRFRLDRYRQDRISYVDAIDPDLFDPVVTAKTGRNFAWSRSSLNSYTRLTRTIDVPSTGASLSFALQRDTEPQFDFALVEAHVAGSASWTTLRDVRGHTTDNPGAACRGLLALHPFLKHYLTDKGDGTCAPSGSTGQWWAATGSSRGWEPWAFNLGRFAGKKVDISITYVSDGVLPFDGVFIDDIAVSTGEGSTSFEEDGNKLDGWTASSPPAGSPPNTVRWTAGADRPSPLGKRVQASFTRQPEVISFLSGYFGRYPFKAAGGTVDDLEGLGFALENQTRPIYSKIFFKDPQSGDSVVVHELAHQWVGDDVTVRGWQDIWLNEGFATYAEWLWSESEGRENPQQLFDFYAAAIPAKSPFWAVKIGDPGTASLFDAAVYIRGAMTLQALRVRIGDELFFQALRTWTAEHAGGNVSSSDFISHVQDIAGENLAGFFQEWLFSPAKPSGAGPTPQLKAPPSGPSAAVRQLSSPPATVRLLEQRLAARAGKD